MKAFNRYFGYLVPVTLLFGLAMLVGPASRAAEKMATVSLNMDKTIQLHCVLTPSRGADHKATCLNAESYERIIKEGDRERVALEFYRYPTGVRMAMVKNALALRAVIEPFEKERNALLKELSRGTGQVLPDTPEFNEFQKQMGPALEKSHEFNLYIFTEAELDLSKNLLPTSVLAVLALIMQ